MNNLIFSGHVDAWQYEYEYYKYAIEDLKKWGKNQVLMFSTGISFLFSNKKDIEQFLKE